MCGVDLAVVSCGGAWSAAAGPAAAAAADNDDTAATNRVVNGGGWRVQACMCKRCSVGHAVASAAGARPSKRSPCRHRNSSSASASVGVAEVQLQSGVCMTYCPVKFELVLCNALSSRYNEGSQALVVHGLLQQLHSMAYHIITIYRSRPKPPSHSCFIESGCSTTSAPRLCMSAMAVYLASLLCQCSECVLQTRFNYSSDA
jgi:hypothetical protein